MRNKILVIDDEPIVLEHIARKLRHSGYVVFEAHNGREGLDIVQNENPDLIVTDIVMPQMDGYTFLKKIKETKVSARIPVIAFSALSPMEDSLRNLGASDFLCKPFKDQELLNKVHFVLQHPGVRKLPQKLLFQGQYQHELEELIKVIKDMGWHLKFNLITDGADLINEVLNTKPGIIIMDIQTKPIPSWEIIGSLRRYDELKDIVILVYSFQSPDILKQDQQLIENKNSCIMAGASAYIGQLNQISLLLALAEYC